MEYTVSKEVQALLDHVVSLEKVQQALRFIEADQEQTLEDQIDIVQVEAPTFSEARRAEHYRKYYERLGLENPHIDAFGNTVGYRKGAGNGKKILMEGHLDTVFPLGTKIAPRRENGRVYAPGIADDTRGLAVCLTVIRALENADINTSADMVFAGMVEEEGIGAFGGIKKYLEANNDITACINIDGYSPLGITYEATGMRTCEVNFYGKGGHSYGAFAKVANPLHAAARAVAKIADIQVPRTPKTTFCVSNFHAGNDAGIHAIVPKATIKFNIRSNSMEELLKLYDKVMNACQEACDEETRRWGKDTITWDTKTLADVAAGTQNVHAPIVEAAYAITKYLGHEPVFNRGGSTNANPAIAKGVPAVCIGMGFEDNKVHTLEEYFPIEGSYQGAQQALLLALMLAGIQGQTPSVLDLDAGRD